MFGECMDRRDGHSRDQRDSTVLMLLGGLGIMTSRARRGSPGAKTLFHVFGLNQPHNFLDRYPDLTLALDRLDSGSIS